MKGYYFLLLFICFNFINTSLSDDEFYKKKYNHIESEQLKVAFNHFQELASKALVLRARVLQFVQEMEANEDKILTGADLEGIQKHILSQLQLREKFYSFIHTYKDRPFLKKEEGVLYSLENRVKAGMIGISAAAILFDNYALCFSVVQKNGKLRRLINKGDSGFNIKEDAFKEIVESFHSPEKRSMLRKAMDWYISQKDVVNSLIKSDKQVVLLKEFLDNSPSVQDIHEGYQFGDYLKFITLLPKNSADSLVSTSETSMNSVSMIFGNSMGLVQTRNGLLYENPEVEKIKSQLKPMDILLEKTPFRLTDKFIPGHFGHVAIWVGTEAELKELGLWEHPVIKPHQEEIREGKSVLEALRDGVQLNTFEKFMDVDDVAILRAKDFDAKEVGVRAFRQLGKDYDFNFDVETIDKIVCSELVYQVFIDIEWPTEKTLGRHTISPDNVAVKVKDGLFSLVQFYHDGKESTLAKYNELTEAK